jgi:hypothetical protein
MGVSRIRDMKRAMELGVFPITNMYFCTALDSGVRSMIDASHRCTVSKEYGHSFRAYIHDETVATEDLKRARWWTIDGDNRDLADFFTALGADEIGIGITDLKRLSNACGYLESQFSSQFLENRRMVQLIITERLAIAERYLRPAGLYFSAIRNAAPGTRIALRNGFNIALGCVLLEGCPEKAVPFYSDIARNNGLDEGDPRHSFHAELTRRGSAEKDLLVHAQRQANFWNSYFLGQTRERCNKLGKGIVVPLKGTRYNIGG